MPDARSLDEIIAAAIEAGSLPPDTPLEARAEAAQAIEAATVLRAASLAAGDEAQAAQDRAAARFARFTAGRPAPAPPWWRRALPRRAAALRTGVAAVTVAAVAAVAVVLALGGGGDQGNTVSAIEPGDYLQIEGRVESLGAAAPGATRYRLATPLGPLDVDLADDAPLTSASGEPASVRPAAGDLLAITGTVTEARRIAASSAAFLPADDTTAPERDIRTYDGDAPLHATIVVVALGADGVRAHVVVEAGGRRLLVPLSPRGARLLFSMDRQLLRLGVTVTPDAAAPGRYIIEPAGTPDPGERPSTRLSGIVTAVDGNVLTIEVARGGASMSVDVVVQRSTRLVLGPRLLAAIREEGTPVLLGQTLTATGVRDGEGRFLAEVIAGASEQRGVE